MSYQNNVIICPVSYTHLSVGKIQRTAVLLRASAEPFLETVSIADGGCNTGYDPREKRFFTEASD